MNINTLVAINLIVAVILLVLVTWVILRLKRLEEKAVDVTPGDVAAFVEQMRDMMVESERVADRLDASIREREEILEDLTDIVDDRVKKINRMTLYEKEPTLENLPIGETSLHNKVFRLLIAGHSREEIARELKITTAEVGLIEKMYDN